MRRQTASALLALAAIASACVVADADDERSSDVAEDTPAIRDTQAGEAPGVDAPVPTSPATTWPTAATTLVRPPGPLLGVAVPEGRIGTIEGIEEEAGARFHLVRVFLRWEDDVADSDIAALQAGGRAIHLSVRPNRRDGSPILWSDIATAQEGSELHDEMVAWADAVVDLGPDLRFTFNHEPETIESAPNGDALDYRAAWRRMVLLIRERGGADTEMVWTVGREVVSSPDGERWYPGDDVVDVVGVDLYNWYTCQGTDRPWTSFAQLLDPAIAFARDRGKPLAVPEFATVADPSDERRRAAWMDAAVDTMLARADDPSVDLDYVAWFDVTAPGGTNPDCRWSHAGDVETSRAFMRMIRGLVGS